MAIHYSDINTAFLHVLKDVAQYGKATTTRDMNVYEVLDYSFIIDNPRHRFLVCPYRYNNICATVAETLWVFDGRNDIGFLEFFLPRAKDFSDDGETWRGAYGPRLYGTDPGAFDDDETEHDQVENVIGTLKKDPSSRQAIIVIPDPEYDYDVNITTKDRPCTVFIQFLVRDDALHCFVRMRSNDVIWGCFNINVFEWTFLQEIIAGILGYKVGQYHHNAVSLHYYDHMDKRVLNILKYHFKEDSPPVENPHYFGVEAKPIKFDKLYKFYDTVRESINSIELSIRDKEIHPLPASVEETLVFKDYHILLQSYVSLKLGRITEAYYFLQRIAVNDIWVAGMELFMRTLKKTDPDAFKSYKKGIIYMMPLESPIRSLILQEWEDK